MLSHITWKKSGLIVKEENGVYIYAFISCLV